MSLLPGSPTISQAELLNNLNRMILIGTVEETDYAKARVRVRVGNWLTAWLPWVTKRAGQDVQWWPVEKGEQVVLLSPGGDMAQAVVLGSLYQQQQQDIVADRMQDAPEQIHRTQYQDGTVLEYDRKNHILRADVKGSVTMSVEKDLSATIQGSAQVTVEQGLDAQVQGDVTVKSKGNLVLDASGDMKLKAGGGMFLNAAHIHAQE